jgi:hypothetical protein
MYGLIKCVDVGKGLVGQMMRLEVICQTDFYVRAKSLLRLVGLVWTMIWRVT